MPFGFPVDFQCGGNTGAFVNNNGNITFDTGRIEYTPFDLASTTVPIIAPYFADVDTAIVVFQSSAIGRIGFTRFTWSRAATLTAFGRPS